jgi:uncharacterized membrane protein
MANSFRTNLGNVAFRYLQYLHIPSTQTHISEKLEENSFYPSLYSLTTVFDRLNIPNEAFQLDIEKVDELEAPFITYLKDQSTGKDFVLVIDINDKEVKYIAEKGKIKTITKEKFLEDWDKIIFVAEKNEQSGEKNFAANQKTERSKQQKNNWLYGGSIVAALLVIVLYFNSLPATAMVTAGIILFTKLVGITIAVLLLIYDIDKSNTLVKSICAATKQTSCDSVLSSKAATFLGMRWGEVGFFYFASSLLFLLLPGIAIGTKIPWLAIAGTLVAPYIVFSIYYQWRVVKKWCPLCLAVQVVLLAELVWSIFSFWQQPVWPIAEATIIIAILIALAIPPIAWFTIKPLLLKAKDEKNFRNAHKRLLYDPEIFNGLLQQQAIAPEGWQELGITIGNPDAANTIIKVCNPYCGPCAKAHPVMEEIIHHNKDVKVKIIFTATNAQDDMKAKPVKHLLAIAAEGNDQLTQQALDDWYMAKKKDYQSFAEKYPKNGELKEQEIKVDAMHEWCKKADISGTPTIFINGKRLPETYSIEELINIF